MILAHFSSNVAQRALWPAIEVVGAAESGAAAVDLTGDDEAAAEPPQKKAKA